MITDEMKEDDNGAVAKFVQDANEARIAQFLLDINEITYRKTEACPYCHREVKSMEKIGRCVYAHPCGCRLWQGTVPEAWKDKEIGRR